MHLSQFLILHFWKENPEIFYFLFYLLLRLAFGFFGILHFLRVCSQKIVRIWLHLCILYMYFYLFIHTCILKKICIYIFLRTKINQAINLISFKFRALNAISFISLFVKQTTLHDRHYGEYWLTDFLGIHTKKT